MLKSAQTTIKIFLGNQEIQYEFAYTYLKPPNSPKYLYRKIIRPKKKSTTFILNTQMGNLNSHPEDTTVSLCFCNHPSRHGSQLVNQPNAFALLFFFFCCSFASFPPVVLFFNLLSVVYLCVCVRVCIYE